MQCLPLAPLTQQWLLGPREAPLEVAYTLLWAYNPAQPPCCTACCTSWCACLQCFLSRCGLNPSDAQWLPSAKAVYLSSLPSATACHETDSPCLQIAPRMRAHALLPTLSGRVAVTHLNLTGRILIGLHLFSRAPGIKGLEVSFITPPELDVKFSPFGVTVTEIPGVLSALKVRAPAGDQHHGCGGFLSERPPERNGAPLSVRGMPQLRRQLLPAADPDTPECGS